MGIVGSIETIILIWWLAFFSMLSVGIKTQVEADSIVPGTEPSAPMVHFLARKALFSLAIAVVLWAVIFAIIHYQIVTYEELTGAK